MKIPNNLSVGHMGRLSLARIVSEDSQLFVACFSYEFKSSKDS